MSEDVGTVTLTVRVLSGVLPTQVSTQFFTSSGSAIGELPWSNHGEYLITESLILSCKAPEDYAEETGLLLTFNSTVTSIDISVSIKDDNILEGNQSFFGNLKSPVGPVTLNPDMVTVTIFDDALERKCLCRGNRL